MIMMDPMAVAFGGGWERAPARKAKESLYHEDYMHII
jgi:hypothetical protein